MIIGGLGTALLFVSIGAGNLETQQPEWEPFKIVSTIDSHDLGTATMHTFDVMMVKYNPDRINKTTGEKIVDPKEHWEYSIGMAAAIEENK